MEAVGINHGFLAALLLTLALLVAWVALAIRALRRLGRRNVGEGTRLLWAAIIVLVPLLGALAFLLSNPKDQPSST